MKAVIFIVLTLLSSLCFSTHVTPFGASFATPNYSGSACPAGTVSSTISPDGSSLSVLFDTYIADVGGISNRSTTRKSCSLIIPITIPQGQCVSIVKFDYRGFNNLPCGAQSTLSANYALGSAVFPLHSYTFNGPIQDSYTIQSNENFNTVTACNGTYNLRISTSLLLEANTSNDEAQSTIDSADMSTMAAALKEATPRRGFTYHLKWHKHE